MSQVQVFNRTFLRGLETTRDESGAPDWSGFRRFLNCRVGKDEAERRGGMAVIATMPDPASSAVFAGVGGVAVCRQEAWALDRPDWVLDFLFHSTDPVHAGVLLDTGSIHISKDVSIWSFSLGGDTLHAPVLPVPNHLALVRDEVGYHLLSEGIEVDAIGYSHPASPATELHMGSVMGSLDFLRLRAPGPDSWRARELRLLNPRGRGVLACYRDGPDANGILWDHSIFEAHMKCNPTTTSASRVSNIRHVPVQGIDTYIDVNDRRRLFIVAGGKEYDLAYS